MTAQVLLRNLQKSTELSPRVFAELCGWSYHTLWRLKTGKTPFERYHLEVLVNAGFVTQNDKWYQEFEKTLHEDEIRLLLSREEVKLIILEALRQYTELARTV